MSYTPLTDAAVLPPSCYWEREIKVVPADFAHSLERANRELREALEMVCRQFADIDRITAWSEKEPEWWVAFSACNNRARSALARVKVCATVREGDGRDD